MLQRFLLLKFHVIEVPNARDQIAFYAIHSFLAEVQAIYWLHAFNIRITISSGRPHLPSFSPLVVAGLWSTSCKDGLLLYTVISVADGCRVRFGPVLKRRDMPRKCAHIINNDCLVGHILRSLFFKDPFSSMLSDRPHTR